MTSPSLTTGELRQSSGNLPSSPSSGFFSKLRNPRTGAVLNLPSSAIHGAKTPVTYTSSPPSIQRTARQEPLSLPAAVIITFIFVFAIFTAWLAIRSKDEGPTGSPKPFCCPKEVRSLFRNINASLDPCANFYLYTCFNRVRFNKTKKLIMRDIYEGDIIQGVGSSKNNTAGNALSGYYRSCLNGILDTDVLCGEMTMGILETFAIREKMAIDMITKFFVMMVGLYHINGALHFVVKGDLTDIDAHYDAAFALFTKRPGCLDHIVATYNSRLKTSITVDEVLKFEKEGLPIPPSTGRTTDSGELVSVIFSFFEVEWRNLARAVAAPTRWMRYPGKEYLFKLFLAIHARQPLSMAYVVSSFVYNAYIKVTRDSNFARNLSGLEISGICQEELDRANNLWETLYAQALASPERDAEFHAIFDQLLDHVSKVAIASNIFNGEDVPAVKSRLQRLKLLLPSDLAIPTVKVPDISDREFGLNYFEVRKYETLMMKVKLAKTYVLTSTVGYFDTVLTRNDFLRLSAGYYRASRFNSNSSKFLNMPVLGVRMAKAMWRYLLTYDGWSDEALEKISNFQTCLKNVDGYGLGQPIRREDETSGYVLAIQSVLSAMRSAPDWHTVKEAWNLIRMSDAQLFYLRYMDSICLESGLNQSHVNSINLPLKYIPDFALTFQCPAESSMASPEELQGRSCWTNAGL